MPDILDNTLNFFNGESQGGCCPICESMDLEYDSYEVVDTCVLYPWVCNTCGAEGKEVGVIEFAGQDIRRESLGSQVEALYCDGGLRPENDIDIPWEKQKKKRDNGAR